MREIGGKLSDEMICTVGFVSCLLELPKFASAVFYKAAGLVDISGSLKKQLPNLTVQFILSSHMV